MHCGVILVGKNQFATQEGMNIGKQRHIYDKEQEKLSTESSKIIGGQAGWCYDYCIACVSATASFTCQRARSIDSCTTMSIKSETFNLAC